MAEAGGVAFEIEDGWDGGMKTAGKERRGASPTAVVHRTESIDTYCSRNLSDERPLSL